MTAITLTPEVAAWRAGLLDDTNPAGPRFVLGAPSEATPGTRASCPTGANWPTCDTKFAQGEII